MRGRIHIGGHITIDVEPSATAEALARMVARELTAHGHPHRAEGSVVVPAGPPAPLTIRLMSPKGRTAP
jgi:hypothetical protein